jgi:hypothetical protein
MVSDAAVPGGAPDEPGGALPDGPVLRQLALAAHFQKQEQKQ